MFCQRCGTEIKDESQRFCHNCGAALGRASNDTDWQSEGDRRRKSGGVSSKINEFVGSEGKVDLHLRDMVSGVFRHHTVEESEELFICGTGKTTPEESDIISEWPKPWLYSRIFLLLLALYFALTYMWKTMGNPFALMNIAYVGTLIGPLTILVFFFEMNVPRNISIIRTFKVFFVGGVASLLLALMIFQIAPNPDMTKISGAVVIGVVEEIGKIGISAFFISKHRGKLYLLNGILYGGAVGAGFAVFESVGYAFYYGIDGMITSVLQGSTVYLGDFYEIMLAIVKRRGFLSPGGHVAWAAVEGFAIVFALKGAEFTWETLVKPKFLKIVWIPVALHALWDAPLFDQVGLVYNCKMIFLVGSIWIILLIFINQGMHQISRIKKETQEE